MNGFVSTDLFKLLDLTVAVLELVESLVHCAIVRPAAAFAAVVLGLALLAVLVYIDDEPAPETAPPAEACP